MFRLQQWKWILQTWVKLQFQSRQAVSGTVNSTHGINKQRRWLKVKQEEEERGENVHGSHGGSADGNTSSVKSTF